MIRLILIYLEIFHFLLIINSFNLLNNLSEFIYFNICLILLKFIYWFTHNWDASYFHWWNNSGSWTRIQCSKIPSSSICQVLLANNLFHELANRAISFFFFQRTVSEWNSLQLRNDFSFFSINPVFITGQFLNPQNIIRK